jgi:hypothetical protein
MIHHLPIAHLTWQRLGFAVVALLAASVAAQGATITITPSYVQSFDAALVPLGALPGDGAATPVGGFLQYEFRMTVDDLAPDEDFWTAILNVQLGPGLQAASEWLDPGTAQLNGYYPQSPSLATYDGNGAAIGGSQFHWQYGNDDFGPDSNDLQSIIIEAAPQEAANRQYGELVRPLEGDPDGLGWPTLLGAILVQRTDRLSSTVTVTPIDGSSWGIYTGNAQGDGAPTAQIDSQSFSGGTAMLAVPEPGTLGLALVAAAAGVLFSRWRARGASI